MSPYTDWSLLEAVDDVLETLGSEFGIELPPHSQPHHRAEVVDALLGRLETPRRPWPSPLSELRTILEISTDLDNVLRKAIRIWEHDGDHELTVEQKDLFRKRLIERLFVIAIRNAGEWARKGNREDERGWFGYLWRSLGFDPHSGRLRPDSDLHRRARDILPPGSFMDNPDRMPAAITTPDSGVDLLEVFDKLQATELPPKKRTQCLGALGVCAAGRIANSDTTLDDRDEALHLLTKIVAVLMALLRDQSEPNLQAEAAMWLGKIGAALAQGSFGADGFDLSRIVDSLITVLLARTPSGRPTHKARVLAECVLALGSIGAAVQEHRGRFSDADGAATRDKLIDRIYDDLDKVRANKHMPQSVRSECERVIGER